MFLKILFGVLGLCFGSFLAAFTYRYPKRISILKGRSFCPNCKGKISWYDNIPLLSFLLLGGKCRDCKKPISYRYPLIELITAIGFLVLSPNILYVIIFYLLFAIFVIDWENQLIPDDLVFVGILILLVSNPNITNVLSGLICAFILLCIHLVTKGRGMGLGDVKFAIMGGMIVGLRLSYIWLFLAFLTGGIASAILIATRKASLKQKIAFGPFLILAIPLALLYGEKILSRLYLN